MKRTRYIDNKRRDRFILIATLIMHIATTFYITQSDFVRLLEPAEKLLVDVYSRSGFEWTQKALSVVTAAAISGFLWNLVRRTLDDLMSGWPKFKDHDANSLLSASITVAGYALMGYFAFGYFGETYSAKPVTLANIFIVSVGTFMFGLLIDFIDEAFSAAYVVLRGGSK